MPELLGDSNSIDTEKYLCDESDCLCKKYFPINSLKINNIINFNYKCEICRKKIKDVEGIAYVSSNLNNYLCPECFKAQKDKGLVQKTKLKYFKLIDSFSGEYFEFRKGKKENWLFHYNNSLYLDDMDLDSDFFEFLNKNISNLDLYGSTLIDKETWEKIKKEAEYSSPQIKAVINELKDFADDTISKYGWITIIGI